MAETFFQKRNPSTKFSLCIQNICIISNDLAHHPHWQLNFYSAHFQRSPLQYIAFHCIEKVSAVHIRDLIFDCFSHIWSSTPFNSNCSCQKKALWTLALRSALSVSVSADSQMLLSLFTQQRSYSIGANFVLFISFIMNTTVIAGVKGV